MTLLSPCAEPECVVYGRMVPTDLGAWVYGRRRGLHWSRAKLSSCARVHRESIRALEEGRREVKPQTLARIIEALTVAEQQLATR